jgi:membrane protein
MSIRKAGGLITQALREFSEDRALQHAAALSYYTVFSIGPALLLVVVLLGLALGEEAARGEIAAHLRGIVGEEGAELIQGIIEAAGRQDGGLLLTVIGIGTLLVTATTAFAQLQASLNAIFHVQPAPGRSVVSTLRAFLVDRLISLSAVLIIGILLLASLVIGTVISALGRYFQEHLPVPELTLQLANLTVSVVVVTLLFAYVYYRLPDVRLAWRDVWIGAFITAVLFNLGKLLIGLYLGRSSVGSMYGAAGSMVVLMLWVYYSSVVFFLGAELTKVQATRMGSGVRPSPGSVFVTQETPILAPEPVRVVEQAPPRARRVRLWTGVAFLAGLLIGRRSAG